MSRLQAWLAGSVALVAALASGGCVLLDYAVAERSLGQNDRDASADAAVVEDAHVELDASDAGALDASCGQDSATGPQDASVLDAHTADASVFDASDLDAGDVDAGGPFDASMDATSDAAEAGSDGAYSTPTTCVGLATCAPACDDGKSCALRCQGAETCAPSCASGGQCVISCVDTAHCNISCRQGSKCVIACDNSDCSQLVCPSGAQCVFLSCTNGALCL